MNVFLTSHLNNYKKKENIKIITEIDNSNGLVNQIKSLLTNNNSVVYFPTDPNDKSKVEEYSKLFFESLKLSGITFDNYYVIDYYDYNLIKDIINNSDMIFLSGGNTYLQNEYFEKINLKEMLKEYKGIILGQSAGAINLADNVYISPEREEYSNRPRYYKGLAKTNINVAVHFTIEDRNFDNDQLNQRNAILEESKIRPIYAIYDTSHIYDNGIEQMIYGECYLITNGIIEKIKGNIKRR